ncbi:MAG: hypothetical protein ACI8Z1_000090 [Candidatus Azotimanducaceae bacterium]
MNALFRSVFWGTLLTGTLMLLATQAQAEVNITGYAKSFVVSQNGLDNALIESDRLNQSQNSVRLMLEGFSNRLVWQVHYELSPILNSIEQNNDLPTFNVASGAYRFSSPKTSMLGDDNKNQLFQNLDRFNVQLQLDAGDLTIGRQAIAFGSARIINPTDVFLPFDVRTFNTEYRTGVDAVRFQRPWGELGEIDFGLVLGPQADRKNSAAFLQVRTNHAGADYHLAIIEYAEQSLIGAGIQSALGNFGFWFEAAHVNGTFDYTRVSTGLDYSFARNVFAQVEYHYNGAGSSDSETYLDQLATLPYQRGGVFLLGEHYLIPSVSVQASPLWTFALQGILNFSDQSAFLSFSAEYNVAKNLYMDFGVYHFSGKDLTVQPAGNIDLGSEYGTNPDTLYTSLRYYF